MKKSIIITSTILVGLFLLFFTMIRNFPPIDINLPTYPELLLGWILFVGSFVASITYLVKFKISHYKKIISLLCIINIIILVIIFTVPLSKIWEDKMLVWHSKDYQKVISLVIKEEIKPVPASVIHYPNQVTESAIILPDELKYLSATRDVWVYRWDKTIVICFTRDGFVGRYSGYCYSTSDEAPNKTYRGKDSEPHLGLGTIQKMKPNWYLCWY